MPKHTILFLAADPSETNPGALHQEVRSIHEELERSGYRDRFTFETRWATRPLDVLRELRRLKPTVVHFSGRGGQDGLCFQTANGSAQRVSPSALAEAFGSTRTSATLVVLSACYSAEQAERLLAHVDCVVGTAGQAGLEAARAYAIGLYGGLGEGEPLERAHEQGCAAVSLTLPDQRTQPQLRARDGAVPGLDLTTEAPASDAPRHTSSSAPRDLLLRPPSTNHAIPRPDLERALETARATSAIVLVEGLSGSGKSTTLARALSSTMQDRVYWYEATANETIDGLFSALGGAYSIVSTQPLMRATELLTRLAAEQKVLVVDGYDLGDQRSFSILLSASRRLQHPAPLFLVSRGFIDPLLAFPDATRVRVAGLTTEQIAALVTKLGGHALARHAHRLAEVCGGLPLAVRIFVALVSHFGRDPESLLEREMMQHDRIRTWFDEVTARIGTDAKKLLAILSIPSRPFTRKLAHLLASEAQIKDADYLLDELHRTFLVTTYRGQRSTVHRLLATLAQATLSEPDRQLALRTTAQSWQNDIAPPLRRIHSRTEFSTLVAACRSFQLAGAFQHSSQVLLAIAGTAKAHGYLEAFIELAEKQLQTPDTRHGWVKYHLSHCYLITGDPPTSLRLAEQLLLETAPADGVLRMGAVRLIAEAQIELGRASEALQVLAQAYATTDLAQLPPTFLSQIRTVECRALYYAGRFEESLTASNQLLEDATRRSDAMSTAIALVRRAVASTRLRRDLTSVEDSLRQAINLFWKEQDRRGHAWALTVLGTCLIYSQREADGLANLRLGLKFWQDSGIYSAEHLREMEALSREVQTSPGRQLLGLELSRLERLASERR